MIAFPSRLHRAISDSTLECYDEQGRQELDALKQDIESIHKKAEQMLALMPGHRQFIEDQMWEAIRQIDRKYESVMGSLYT